GALLGLMPAHLAGDPGSFALKAICIVAANRARGLDAHQGLVVLFSGETGVVTAILNASALTEIRTAAVTAAATRALARDDAESLAIVGAGVQGRAHLRALRGVRPWREVRIASRTPSRATALAADASELLGGDGDGDGAIGVVVAPDARAAVTGADVVVLATSSREPVIERDWLVAGGHVNAIGASTLAARELDVKTVADAALFCDSRESLLNEALEFRLASEEGAIDGEDHIRAELGELFSGRRPGRRDPAELTLFRSLGVGIEDLAAAELAVAQARELGVGTEVSL
ncbi:MAG: ornithine cyclodeaminase family protein, partial [Polyangiaceae bacterium]|nr:ornithine cyclodeaminase family protein [Polyangiaceae bacterium]